MNASESNWEKAAKQGMLRDITFTKEMTDRVFREIGRRNKREPIPLGRLMKPALAVVACVALAVLFVAPGKFGEGSDGFVPGSAAQMEWPLSYQVLEAPTLQPGETILASDPDILPGLSNKHDPLYKRMITNELALSDVELLDTRPVDGFGTMLHYRLLAEEEDQSPTYFGFALGEDPDLSTFYHIGYGHMFELATHGVTRVFGKPALKVEQLKCRTDGESCAWYFTLEQDGPMYYMMFEAKSMERDLDGDGVEELVVATEKLNQIYLFKEMEDRLHWVSLREVLGAEPDDNIAYHHDEGLFSIITGGSEQPAYYRVSGDGTVLVQVR